MKLQPVDKNYATPQETALRTQWEKNLSAYKKPARPDALAPRNSGLLHSGKTTNSLGYLLYVDSKQVRMEGAGAIEFAWDDPEPLRKATLTLKTVAGFHVYYKHEGYWYGVPIHFNALADALPYLQSGNRVIVEYRITPKK